MVAVLVLGRKVDDGAAHLHCLVIELDEWRALLDQNKGTKLRIVVLEEELAVLELDASVATTDGDVVDSQIAFMTPAQLEDVFLLIRSDYMDDA